MTATKIYFALAPIAAVVGAMLLHDVGRPIVSEIQRRREGWR